MLNAVNNDREPLIVTRRRGKPVVLMSLEEYQAMGQRTTPTVETETANGLWKSLSEVDEITFLPANGDGPKG